MWLTRDEYISMGGTAPENEYASLELKVRKRVEYRTLERIKTPDEDIKKLMFELINMQHAFDNHNSFLSGYGNDGVTASYVSPEAARADFEKKADALILSVVGDLAYRGLSGV